MLTPVYEIATGPDVAEAGGTVNAIAAQFAPAITALVDGMRLYVKPVGVNTQSTVTFTPNPGVIEAKTLVPADSDPYTGMIMGGATWMILEYKSTQNHWVLLNPAPMNEDLLFELSGNSGYGDIYRYPTSSETNAIAYTMSIESTNGTEFRVGDNSNTTLKAHVFLNGKEITEELPSFWFRWRRVSKTPRSIPYDDETWNTQYLRGYKSIFINVDDVYSKATFFCDLISP